MRDLDPDEVKRAVKRFRHRIEAVVCAEGGHIE